MVNRKDFEKSDTERETFDNIEEIKHTQEYKNSSINISGDLNEKGINNNKIQKMFKRGRHNSLSTFIINQDDYELPKKTIRANGNNYHIFKPDNFLAVRNIYQDKASMDMTLDEFKYLASTCWKEKCQPLTIDRTEVKYCGRYRLGIKLIFVPNSSSF